MNWQVVIKLCLPSENCMEIAISSAYNLLPYRFNIRRVNFGYTQKRTFRGLRVICRPFHGFKFPLMSGSGERSRGILSFPFSPYPSQGPEFLNPHRILKKTYVEGEGGNDPKTKIAVTFFLRKKYW